MKRVDDARVMAFHAKLNAQNAIDEARAETFLKFLEHPDSVQLRSEPNKEELDQLNSSGAALKEGNYASAIQTLRKLLDSNSQSKDGWDLLALAYLSCRRYEEAITAFKKQIDLSHDITSAYNGLGRAYWGARRYSDAEAAFRDQLGVNPRDNSANANLGNLYLDWHKYVQAAFELQKAASIKPNDASIQVSLGSAYLNLGQDDKAMAAYDLAIKLSSTPTIWNNIAYALALKNTHLNTAREYAQLAIKATSSKLSALSLEHLSMEDVSLVSSIGSYWDTLGWIYYTAGDLQKAERYLSAAWQLTQQSLVGDHLGQIYEKRGDKQKAIEMYALALDAYRPSPELRQRLAVLVGGEENVSKEATTRRELFLSQHMVPLNISGAANATAEFLVLLAPSSPGARGTRVEAVKFIKGDEQLRNFETPLRGASYPITFAEDRVIKIVRRGTVSCSSAGDCVFSMMLPGDVMSTD
ncbi:MAG: tetratricopeptide repeat protein [Acidobacteria bacterium]|nr:tetratricopeptide repeat protein [Acidobacteriota bacterium]